MDYNALNCAVEVEALTVAYDIKPVLWDIDLRIPKGKLMAVIGPNGAGKTTLIKAMLGLVVPVSGCIRFFPGEKEDTGRMKRRVGYVPQSDSVDWDFPATVLDVVLMGRYGMLGWVKRPTRADREIALQMIETVGMQDYISRQISRLSGGQRQRVFLARALVQQADIYFLDEPFRGVDARTEKAIVLILKELREQGKTVVAVHHDLQTVVDYFDWVTVINLKMISSGPVSNAFTEDSLKKAYRSGGTLLKSVV